MRLLCSIIVVLVMMIIIRVRGHVYLTGSRCPNAPPMEDFDMQKFLGVWYAIEKSRSFSECLTYNISQPDPDRNPDDYRLQQTSVMMRSLISYTGRLRAPSRNATRRTGHMTVQFPLNMVGRSSFQVFSTDYTSYAAIYTCQPLMFLHRHSVTLLSRTKELDERVLRDLRYRMYDSNIQSLDLRRIEQEDCAAARDPQRTSEVKLAGWAKYHSSRLFPAEDEENTAAEVSDISQEKEGKIDRKETFVETVGSQDDSHETDNDYIDIIERHRKTRWF